MGRFTRPVAVVALIAGTVAAGGCATSSPSIADIKYNPGRYYDRTVSVQGVVRSAWGVPFVPFQVYKIEDSTGELTVVSDRDRVPPPGARVEVRGRVQEVAALGGRSLGLHLREDRVKVYSRY